MRTGGNLQHWQKFADPSPGMVTIAIAFLLAFVAEPGRAAELLWSEATAAAFQAEISHEIPRVDRSEHATPESLRSLEEKIAASRFQEVAPLLAMYLKDHPASARGHYDLGYVLFRTHNVESSVKELSRSLQLDINNAEAHKILGLDCTLVGRYDL